jgi:lipopolysaccharide transport system ATP-binding protein
MSDIALRVEGLSKQYCIGSMKESYRTLRDTLTDAFVAPFRRARKLFLGQATGASELDETIWALKDVFFEVKKGEVLGIIGRNGAGKSTLLKILSRITEPTEGYAEIHGRIATLLEVGTGFHPELTGRENIYLNGAILGMKRGEIERKFDEIVAFAEVEKFIHTPVKHYSSGMYLRLAFAVAAHLEPEILIVDEVLAVGDAAFQQRCLGKMHDVAGQGRTVLFVSHNMAAISSLCHRALLLSAGRVVGSGPSDEMIKVYLKSTSDIKGASLIERKERQGSGEIRIEEIWMEDCTGRRIDSIRSGADLVLIFRYRCRDGWIAPRIVFKFTLRTASGMELALCSTGFTRDLQLTFQGDGLIRVRILRLPLAEGEYTISHVLVGRPGEYFDSVQDSFVIKVYGAAYSSPSVYLQPTWELIENERLK